MISTELVAFKGTRNGILASMSDTCEFSDGLAAFTRKVAENPSFFKGSPMSLDLGWRELRPDEFEALNAVLQEHCVRMLGVISSSLATRQLLEARGLKVIIGRLGLSEHQGRQIKSGGPPRSEAVATQPPQPAAPAPPANLAALGGEPAVVLRRTLRSGQRAEFEGSIIILGDVNAGAHVEASGDVLIMGALRGTAHAGCKGKVTASVFALTMQPAQIRIADVVADGVAFKLRNTACLQARLEGGKITYSPLRQV